MQSLGGRKARFIAILTAALVLTGGSVGHGSRGKHHQFNPVRAGEGILVVGDSLQVGSGPYLERRLGRQVMVLARRGRDSSVGLDVLWWRISPRHGAVVFDVGSNDDEKDPEDLAANLRSAKRLAGPRCMVVSTINPASRDEFNAVIREFAEENPSVLLFRWQRLTQRRPDLLQEDGIHATELGYEIRAAQLIRTLRRCPPLAPRVAHRSRGRRR